MAKERNDGSSVLAAHTPKVRRTQRRINPAAFTALIVALTKGDHSPRDLVALTGLCEATIRHYTRSLHGAKLIFIFGWDRDALGRDCLPRYKWGDGVDMPRRSRDAGTARKQARVKAATINFHRNGRRHDQD